VNEIIQIEQKEIYNRDTKKIKETVVELSPPNFISKVQAGNCTPTNARISSEFSPSGNFMTWGSSSPK